MSFDAHKVYKSIKDYGIQFEEEKHCVLLLSVMTNKNTARVSAFCAQAEIGIDKFYKWLKQSDVFLECYALGQMFAKEIWEREGEEIALEPGMPGCANHRFEHWRMVGWARFGVAKNSRIRLDLNPKSTPAEHYTQLLQQAANGDFTAGELKQLMEAINVGLSAHQVCELQKEIDALKADLATMEANSNGNDSRPAKGITKED